MKSSRNTVAGLTLIELLIAVAIAGLLIAVILAVYGSILHTIAVQSRWREKVAPAADALDIMIRDLACVVIPFGITNQPFTAEFTENSEKSFQMSFYSAFPTRSARSEASERAGSSNDWRSYSISHVCYSLQTAGRTGEFVLTRECNPFRIPSRNPLASGGEKWRGIKKLNIVFFNGLEWNNRWGGEGEKARNTNSLPQSVRISLIAGEDGSREIGSEVFINAARQIVAEKSK